MRFNNWRKNFQAFLKRLISDTREIGVLHRKNQCNFEMLCSRVRRKETYRIKTYLGDHTCPRVFNNRSASSKWVVGKVVERMRGSRRMRMIGIVEEVKF